MVATPTSPHAYRTGPMISSGSPWLCAHKDATGGRSAEPREFRRTRGLTGRAGSTPATHRAPSEREVLSFACDPDVRLDDEDSAKNMMTGSAFRSLMRNSGARTSDSARGERPFGPPHSIAVRHFGRVFPGPPGAWYFFMASIMDLFWASASDETLPGAGSELSHPLATASDPSRAKLRAIRLAWRKHNICINVSSEFE